MVMESTGGLSQEALSLLKAIYRFGSRRQNIQHCVYAGRAWARLSCNLQTSVAQAILCRIEGWASSSTFSGPSLSDPSPTDPSPPPVSSVSVPVVVSEAAPQSVPVSEPSKSVPSVGETKSVLVESVDQKTL